MHIELNRASIESKEMGAQAVSQVGSWCKSAGVHYSGSSVSECKIALAKSCYELCKLGSGAGMYSYNGIDTCKYACDTAVNNACDDCSK